MSNQVDEQLDRLLNSWADQHRAADDCIADLRRRIVADWEENANDESTVPASPTVDSVDPTKLWRSVALAAIAVAATLLVALFVVSLGQTDNAGPQPASRSKGTGIAVTLPPGFAWLNDDQLAGKRALMQEMERVFRDRFTWLAETNGHVEMGLVDDDQLGDMAASPLAVRVVVMRRTPDDPAGVRVWAVDLLTRNEQLVRLSPKRTGEASLTLWAYVMPDGQIAVDTDLDLPGTHAMHPTTSTVQKTGKPNAVYRHRLGDAEYVVYQTVSEL